MDGGCEINEQDVRGRLNQTSFLPADALKR